MVGQSAVLRQVLLLVCGLAARPTKRAADALAVGGAEPVDAMRGFYGNPLYRPYGFGAWGFGSHGYMLNSLVLPNLYGGFHYSG